jgi:hypothetical protein
MDNDLPCDDCAAYGQPPVAACATCPHQRTGAHGPVCRLTTAPLPTVGGCCHHGAVARVTPALALDALPVAPWLLAAHRVATAAALLARHPSAPELERRDGRVWLRLDDLAVPLVYGVTADAWDTAIALPAPDTIPDAPPHFHAALEALEALHADGDPAPASARLRRLLVATPLETLPAYWRGTVTETLALLDERNTP